MSEDRTKRVSWRGALLLEGTEPVLVKVAQASATQFELICPCELKSGDVLRFFLEVFDAATKQYIPMRVKAGDSVLVASANHFRCTVKVNQIDAGPQNALKTALSLVG